MLLKKNREVLGEFFRYILVGGSAFLIDFLVIIFFNECVFKGEFLYFSVFLGYLIGLIYNFVFSCVFVFKNGMDKIKHKEGISFIIFTVIGILGLGLTEMLMYILVDCLNIYYIYSKMVTAIVVMFWNYIARKKLVFK